jgi:hypothetical protein
MGRGAFCAEYLFCRCFFDCDGTIVADGLPATDTGTYGADVWMYIAVHVIPPLLKYMADLFDESVVNPLLLIGLA